MTIQQLLATDTTAMTDAQLIEVLAPFFPKTRPSRILVAAATDLDGLPDDVRAIIEAQRAEAKRGLTFL